MSEQDDIADLVRAVRARVPMDAAQMLVKETPERIGAVLAELPQILVDRIKAYLPATPSRRRFIGTILCIRSWTPTDT